MELTIENGVLKACALTEKETNVGLPDSVTAIDDYAFARVPAGQIKFLFLPDGLRRIGVHAFSGLGELDWVTAYTYGADDDKRTPPDPGEGSPDCLKTKALVLRKGGTGWDFFMDDMLIDRKGGLKTLLMDSGMNVRPTRRDLRENGDQRLDAEELIVYFAYEDGDIAPFDPLLIRNTTLKDTLKKLRFASGTLLCRQRDEIIIHYPYTFRFSFPQPEAPGEEWEWYPICMPLDCRGMQNLEEVILPDGLISIQGIRGGAFADCPRLKKVVIPASVNTIGDGAFRRCPSLRKVLFSQDAEVEISPSAFAGNPKLRLMTLYRETGPCREKKRIASVDAASFLAPRHAKYLHGKIQDCLRTLAQKPAFQQERDDIAQALKALDRVFAESWLSPGSALPSQGDPARLFDWLDAVEREIQHLRSRILCDPPMNISREEKETKQLLRDILRMLEAFVSSAACG